MNSILKILLSMIIWGSIGLFVRNINLPSLEIAFLRAIIASGFLVICGIWSRGRNKSSHDKKSTILLVFSGFAIGLNWVLLFQAFKYTTLSNATLSYYFAPAFVVLLSPIVLKEKLTYVKILSVLGAILGLFLILSNQKGAANIDFNHFKGMVYGLMAAVLYGSVVLLNKYIKKFSGYEMTLIQITSAAVILLPFVISRNNLRINGSLEMFFVIIIGIVHTGVAYLFYFSGIKGVRAQSAAVLSYIDPVSAVLFGTLILREPLSLIQAAGGLLILGSTFLGEKSK